MRRIDLTGQTFNRLTVIERVPGHKLWRCRCICGAEKAVQSSNLKNGTTKSCGCWAKERMRARNTTHGMSHTPEFGVWSGAKTRCFNQNSDCYADYGGRGITMCEAWRDDFTAFYRDMGPRPSASHQIDRITDGPYAPGNCRWVTVVEQQNNRRSNVRVTVDGQGMTMKQAARLRGAKYHRVHQRVAAGWPLAAALSRAPSRKHFLHRSKKA